MAITDKTTVKSTFQTGDTPTQANFDNLIDSTTVPLVGASGNVSGDVATDASTADIFQYVLTNNIVLKNPTNNIDGKSVTWHLTQGSGGSKTITLDTMFVIPSSATTPLAFSTAAGKTDILAARYNGTYSKYMIISMVPGYTL